MKVILGLRLHRVATLLRADLHYAVEPSGRADELLAFPMVVGERLFHVDVLARLARPNSRQRVPMIARGDHDCVDILVVEQLPKVRVLCSTAVLFSRALKVLLVRVTQGRDPHIAKRAELLEQLVAAAARSNKTKIQL